MTLAIRLDNITKTFGRGKRKVEAVKNVSLEIEARQVYGFLGPNGAGKTTTIRMLLDLMRPTQGSAHIYGQNVQEHNDVLRRVGMLVEGPSFYPYLTGRRNLEILARSYGNYDLVRIDALLEEVDLLKRAKQKYRKYSLGMKQRLGLAAALLHDPELVILDEPTNGLDPAGIQEMRALIRNLVDHQGKTVFLSSHLLSEVEQVCDRVAIINKGEIIREGAVSTLVAERAQVRIQATPHETARQLIAERWPIARDTTANGLPALLVDMPHEEVPHAVRKLVEGNVQVFEITTQKQTLEEVFLSLTGTPVNAMNGVKAGEKMEAAQ
ncbi:MAG: ABC transporter ATP-binding protein [Anaerolineae bacterium]